MEVKTFGVIGAGQMGNGIAQVMETLFDGFKDSKYRPCPLLRKYVEAGWLGRKTGRGFYEYK